jgi:hypothetical protein
MDIKVSCNDGNVTVEGDVPKSMDPDGARVLARMLLCAAEGAQSFRSRRGDGMPEQVTLAQMRNMGAGSK